MHSHIHESNEKETYFNIFFNAAVTFYAHHLFVFQIYLHLKKIEKLDELFDKLNSLWVA